eukprot:6203920-Pleurochrysis_carterae.AAC.3
MQLKQHRKSAERQQPRSASLRETQPHSSFLAGAFARTPLEGASFRLVADDDDEDGNEDEVPDVRMGSSPRKRGKPSEPRIKAYSTAEGAYAYVRTSTRALAKSLQMLASCA